MFAPDVGTLLLGSTISITLCAAVMLWVWWQNRVRSPETALWFADYTMLTVGIVLIALRGVVPLMISVVLANTLIVGGTILLHIGLQRYVGRPGPQWHNLAILVLFAATHTYFLLGDDHLAARDANLSIAILLVTGQSAWLMLRSAPARLRAATRSPGLVFVGICVVSLMRVVLELAAPRVDDMFAAGPATAFGILSWQMLFVALTFSLLLMVNSRLVKDLEADIVTRQEAQEALRKSEEKFAIAFQNIPDSLLVTRVRDGRIVEANDTFFAASGYTPEATLGSTTLATGLWCEPEDRRQFLRVLEEAGRVVEFEARLCLATGQVIDATLAAQTIELEDEPHILTIIHDSTLRKRAEHEVRDLNATLEQRVEQRTRELVEMNEQLIEANMRLDEATRAKSDFLAAMSHELRTPLNSIIGFSDLLSRGLVGELTPEQHKQVAIILGSGRYLLELVSEVLDLTAIESGHVTVASGPVDVRTLAADVIAGVELLASDKGLETSWAVADDLTTVISDGRRLKQLLLNLAGNSVKFTDAGRVHLSAVRQGDDAVFVVTDTGRGIAPEDLPRVFEQFFQAARDDVAKSTGTGLGLTVCQRLAEMLGGSVSAESVVGAGSVFAVRIPVAQATART